MSRSLALFILITVANFSKLKGKFRSDTFLLIFLLLLWLGVKELLIRKWVQNMIADVCVILFICNHFSTWLSITHTPWMFRIFLRSGKWFFPKSAQLFCLSWGIGLSVKSTSILMLCTVISTILGDKKFTMFHLHPIKIATDWLQIGFWLVSDSKIGVNGTTLYQCNPTAFYQSGASLKRVPHNQIWTCANRWWEEEMYAPQPINKF